jgi:hypothetical protein
LFRARRDRNDLHRSTPTLDGMVLAAELDSFNDVERLRAKE